MSLSEQCSIELPAGGFAPDQALDAVKEAALPALLQRLCGGPFGHSAAGLGLLEACLEAADLGLLAAQSIEGLILATTNSGDDFSSPSLTTPQKRFVAAFEIIAIADGLCARLETLRGDLHVEGMLEMRGLEGLLDTSNPARLAARILRLSERFIALKQPTAALGESASVHDRVVAVAQAMSAFMTLLRRAVAQIASLGALSPLLNALSKRKVTLEGTSYQGFERRAVTNTDVGGLLPMMPEQIVGNVEYIRAGMRLARDVSAFDLKEGKNPKRINPILFGLGRPGCGKTVTAHAIGNAFLRDCQSRGIPARFQVIQRTDWASSYQNASAGNLVKIFKELYEFEGVFGVYWPDIDTAFASRSSNQLRSEEKQNLGAIFGLFDGTLIPRDGKWFLICDANTLHMDEATISRIAQNPFRVTGPTTPSDFVTLIRDLQLSDLAKFLPSDDEAWTQVGAAAAAGDLSGRSIEAICNNIRAEVQDFEYPDEYFSASSERRAKIIEEESRPVPKERMLEMIKNWIHFHQAEEGRAAEQQFQEDVDALVRQLNAGRIAAQRAFDESIDTPTEAKA